MKWPIEDVLSWKRFESLTPLCPGCPWWWAAEAGVAKTTTWCSGADADPIDRPIRPLGGHPDS